jgi:hypothetical protein
MKNQFASCAFFSGLGFAVLFLSGESDQHLLGRHIPPEMLPVPFQFHRTNSIAFA